MKSMEGLYTERQVPEYAPKQLGFPEIQHELAEALWSDIDTTNYLPVYARFHEIPFDKMMRSLYIEPMLRDLSQKTFLIDQIEREI